MSEAKESFEDFYNATFHRFARLAFVFVRDAQTADDLVQEAMLRVQRNYPNLASPVAYTRTVLLNLVRRHGSREARRRAAEARLVPCEQPAGDGLDILQLVDLLPQRQRTVIILRYYEDLSEREIADALGCRPGTVKSLAARALAKLREKVD